MSNTPNNLRITYTVSKTKTYEFEGNGLCDLSVALKRLRREAQQQGMTVTHWDWTTTNHEREE